MPNEDMNPLWQPYRNKRFNGVWKVSDVTFFRPPRCHLFSTNHAVD